MLIPKEAIALLKEDKELAPYLNHKFDSVPGTGDAYEGLISSIVSQQLSVKAAATIYGRFLDLFSDQYPQAEKLLKFTDGELRNVGLSGQKTKYVRNVANFFNEHNLYDHDWGKYSDKEIIDKLTTIKGVGVWTVEMILMFTLDRPDVLPVGDLGIQNAMKEIYNIKKEKRELHKKMVSVAKPWQPYRSIACRYLWAYKDNPPLSS